MVLRRPKFRVVAVLAVLIVAAIGITLFAIGARRSPSRPVQVAGSSVDLAFGSQAASGNFIISEGFVNNPTAVWLRFSSPTIVKEINWSTLCTTNNDLVSDQGTIASTRAVARQLLPPGARPSSCTVIASAPNTSSLSETITFQATSRQGPILPPGV